MPSALAKTLRYRWLIFGVLGCGYILVYFHRLCPAVLAVDMMRDLQTGGVILGLLSSAYFYPYAIMQLPAGILADSWGARRTIPLFLLVAATGSLLLSQATSLGLAVVGRGMVGLGVSMLFAPTMKVLSEWFRAEEFAIMTGSLLALGGLGALFSTVPLAMLSDQVGWRSSFLIVALLTLILALLIWLIVRDRPADLGWQSPITHPAETTPKIKPLHGMLLVIRSRSVRPIILWFFLLPTIYLTFAGLWGGPFLQQIYGFTPVRVAKILSLTVAGKIFGSFFLVWLSNRIFKGRKAVLVLSSLVTLAITLILVFATDQLNLASLYIICFLLGAFSSGSAVIGFTAAKELFPPHSTGTAIGLVTLFPFAGTAILQPLLGWILERHGQDSNIFGLAAYQQAFTILLICASLSLVAGLFAVETLPRKPGK
ncbi:Sugar phosphate permease [Desulfuromusa kysingii]|uniref:Sugar phosphate permease n=1 Tax=Desulfuromusa kysingii TaxID=37625 RepID=A0A1H4AUN9_9BACT|nr:MFS transporter [Desulfuromusa kysingii]SEA39517.1 Sugar phosphate permease [Desulfuromusa kysingii]